MRCKTNLRLHPPLIFSPKSGTLEGKCQSKYLISKIMDVCLTMMSLTNNFGDQSMPTGPKPKRLTLWLIGHSIPQVTKDLSDRR